MHAMGQVPLQQDANILLIGLNGIGNLILTTPLIKTLKRNFPKGKLTVLALPDSKQAVENNPYVDSVIVYPAASNLLTRIIFLLGLRKRTFDASIYPYPNGDVMSAILSFLIGATHRINFSYHLFGLETGALSTLSIPVYPSKHDVQKNLDVARALGLKIYSDAPFMPITAADKKTVDALLKGRTRKKDILIGLHVGSKEGMRIWPTDNFAKLTGLLGKHNNVKILLVGTALEEALITGYSEFKGGNIINLINKATIPQTAEAIRRCRLFITTDSGPMHMAVSVGTQVIAIYLGPFILRTGPYGKKHLAFVTNRATKAIDKNKNHLYVARATPSMVYASVKKILKLG